MSLTATDNVTELDISELVDMEKQPGCEHSGHPTGTWNHHGPAWGIIRIIPHCGRPSKAILICHSGYRYGMEFGVRCTNCGMHRNARDAWELVSIL
jgi:hypothetical protein